MHIPQLKTFISFFAFSLVMHHNIHLWWRYFPQRELTHIYVSSAVRSFALSLVGLFIPLYLYKELGFSLEETLGFFIFYSVIFAVSTPVAAKFSARYGVKHAVLVSSPFYLAFLVLLYVLPNFDTSLLLIAAFLGLSQSFYWVGMHVVFFHASDHRHRGEEVGKRLAVSILSTVLGPLLGGAFIMWFGFRIVFFLSSLLLVFSALVLFLSKEEHVRYHFSVRSVLNKEHWRNSLFFVSQGCRVIADGVIWPLFVFVVLDNYFSLGVVGSLLAGISAVLIWLVGKYSDHYEKRKIILFVTPLESVSWWARALATSVGGIFGATIFGALTHGIREAPLGAMEYDKAKGDITAYFVSREIFICLGRILLLMVVLMTHSLAGGLVFQGIVNSASLLF